MRAEQKDLLCDFINGNIKNFIIPIYQRNYDWNIEQCSTLYNDILNIIKNKNTHFFGSIVSSCEPDKKYLIIDGQQRLTTINLILIAIYRLLDDNEESILKKQIYEEYLINRFEEDDNLRLKLKVSKGNKKDFSNLFDLDIEQILENKFKNRLYENFLYYYNNIKNDIKNGKYSLKDLFEALKKLVVVDILLEPNNGDNPQLIFETLNSTGKKLEQSDLIRNFLLMNLQEDEQEKLYNDYWLKIEENCHNNIEEFSRFFLIFITSKSNIKKENIYDEFTKLYNEQKITKEEIADKLLKYSKYYKDITKYSIVDNDYYLNKHLQNILSGNFLECSVIIPFLFYLLDKYYENKITKEELLEILTILESFLFRRSIVYENTAGLNKIFSTLGKNIDNSCSKKSNCTIKLALIDYINNYKNPSDDLFIDRFINLDIPKKRTQFLQHILIEIEKLDNKEFIGDNLEVEHIAPESLNSKWKNYLGEDDYNSIKDHYVNTIGNLTLINYDQNQESNALFLEKQNKYATSNIKLTKDLYNYNSWNVENIIKRANILANKAIQIWKYYKNDTTFIANNKITLSTNYDFTATKVEYFKLNSVKYEVGCNWNNVYSKIIELLYEYDENTFNRKILENQLFSTFISNTDNFRIRRQIKNFFIEENNSTQTKINNLIQIIETLDYNTIDTDSIEFVLKNKN